MTHKRVIRFPKPSRYSLGVRMENTLLEIIEFSYLALTKQNASKLLIINKVDITLRMFFMHLRLANGTRCLNDAGYAELSEGALEIGRMIGNWIKEIREAKTAQNAQLTLEPLV
ncbi:MAG: four helix bundle protein [bacterium]|nr:four helix bundle protein [bacterium]